MRRVPIIVLVLLLVISVLSLGLSDEAGRAGSLSTALFDLRMITFMVTATYAVPLLLVNGVHRLVRGRFFDWLTPATLIPPLVVIGIWFIICLLWGPSHNAC